MSLELIVKDLGKLSYSDAWKIQKDYFEQRKKDQIPDHLLLAEHPPTISFGNDEKWNTLHVTRSNLDELGIKFMKASRGGGAAYLGPGQLVGYAIMDIRPYGGALEFLKLLERVMIKTAKDFEINIEQQKTMNPTTDKLYRATWYIDGKKPKVLCTKGIGISLGKGDKPNIYTHHGFALHVNRSRPDYFHLIDPCGFPITEVEPIAMNEIVGENIDMNSVKTSVISHFKAELKIQYKSF